MGEGLRLRVCTTMLGQIAVCLFIYLGLGIELRPLCLPGRPCATEVYSWPQAEVLEG